MIFIAIFADNRYHYMYYEYNPESIDDILKVMAANAKNVVSKKAGPANIFARGPTSQFPP